MDFSIFSVFIALLVSASSLLYLLFVFRKPENKKSKKTRLIDCNCDCNCDFGSEIIGTGNGIMAAGLNDGTSSNGEGGGEMSVEKHTGASMMEQLVPEITTHALSYLDYPSLCRLSMTNSLMRRAANDDNAWKALYYKDFTLEQDSLIPPNGWKAYYAATRAIVTVNADFFRIVREKSLPAMGQFWLNSKYVKCFHANGELFSGYDDVIRSWQLAFTWENVADFQIRDVRSRVSTDMAWVSMKAYVNMEGGPFNVTNIYEFHNGRWYMVHHHSSALFILGGGGQQLLIG